MDLLHKNAPVQKKADTNSQPGKSMAPPGLSLTAGPLQMQTDKPPGRGQCTEFGDYWIVPDNTKVCYANVKGEQVTESQFAKIKAAWDSIKSGSGSIKIAEADSAGKKYAGFKTKILTNLGKLMKKPKGRGLLMDLVGASNSVTIRPSSSQIYGGANAIRGGSGTLEKANGKAGSGGTTIIQIDADLKDTDIVVNDKAGKEISDPVFIILGHELIHAKHNDEGRNRRNKAASSAAYSNLEEEETISTGSLTEKDLRTEHGLDIRVGHSGRDTR